MPDQAFKGLLQRHGLMRVDRYGHVAEGRRRAAVCLFVRDADAELPPTFQLKVSRHSCALALLNDGVPLKMISERLGHSSIAVTGDIYAVVEEAQQREVSERLERLFGSGKI
jgi:integrase